MAELADALDSGSNGRKAVQVQVLLPAPCLQSRFPLIEGIGSVAISKQVLMVVLITITDWKRASHLQCSPCLRSLDIVGAHSG